MAGKRGPGSYWSATNPIPTISQFVEGLDTNKKDRDKEIDEAQRREREREKSRRGKDGEAVPHKSTPAKKHGRRKVTDPTTGKEIEIDDVGKEYMKAVEQPQISVPNANLGLPTKIKTSPDQPYEEYRRNQDITAPPDPIAEGTVSDVPIHGEKTNVLFHPTPSVSYEPMFKIVEQRAGIVCIGVFLSILIPGHLAEGSLKWLFPLAFCVASAVWLWMKDVIKRGRTFEWSSEKLRGETATANLLPESVEWINAFLELFWGLIDPETFAAVADTLEDVMQASVPGVIENVRVAEIDQGSNPFRILSLRSLPDAENEDLAEAMRNNQRETKSEQEVAANEEAGGHYNLECAFAYHAKPGTTSSSKAANMHMLLVFYLGIKGLFGVPFPIFTELIELVGTVRLRLQLTPEPPFAKSVTFTLMGLPHVRAGCTPMFKTGVNILNLPLISNFVNYAIGAAASMYVAPKSMTLDLDMMLQGDTIQKDTLAMGVMWVNIKRAIDLSKQDQRGSPGGGSDPYINLSFSKYGKPMYCTRIICDDRNPVWRESAALLVTPDLIKADEQLSVELWDSDRNTADDIVGKIEISMQEMIQHPGKIFAMESSLQGLHADTEMPGKLLWEVGYFGKPHFRKALRTDGKDPNVPDNMKGNPALQDEKGTLSTEEQIAVTHTPPDPLWPSGICSIVVHQIVNLQTESNKGTLKNRGKNIYGPARGYGENTEEEGKDLPTSYCNIHLNDTLVYRTRAKAVSSKPVFNAGTERFVRDWRTAIVTITVRDQRHREHDPILGIVPLKLADILQTSSQATRWYPLDGGIGYGRIRVSLLFRSVELKLPPNLLGWDVGTFELASDSITTLNYGGKHTRLRLRTSGVSVPLPRSASRLREDGDGAHFDLSKNGLKEKCRLPVKYRYRSAIIFEFRDTTNATGVFWLSDMMDNEETQVDIAIWTAKNTHRLTQNYITEENWEQKKNTSGLEDLTQVGRLQCTVRFSPGLDESHEQLIDDSNARETYETWEECLAEGVRERTVTMDLPPTVRELHRKSLIQQRDILRQASPEERKRVVENDQTSGWLLQAEESGQNLEDLIITKPPRDKRDSAIDMANNSRPSKEHRESKSSGEDSPMSHGAQRANEDAQKAEEDEAADQEEADDDYEHEDNDSFVTTERSSSHRSRHPQAETVEARAKRLGRRENKRSEHRKQRGVMQWKRARNAAFAKNQAGFAMKKVRRKFLGDLRGREPDIETEA